MRLSRAARLRWRWLLADNSADYALMLVALWFLTQINPASPLFGVVVMPGMPQPFESPIADPALFCFCWKPAGEPGTTATLLFIASFLAHGDDYAPVLGGFFLLAWWFKVAVAPPAAGGVFCLVNPACTGRFGAGRRADLCCTKPPSGWCKASARCCCWACQRNWRRHNGRWWPPTTTSGLFRWAYH